MFSMHFLSQEAAKDGAAAKATVAMPAATMNLFTRASSDEAVETAEYLFFAERRERRAGTQAGRRNIGFFETGEIEVRLVEMKRHDRRGRPGRIRRARRNRCVRRVWQVRRRGDRLPAARRLRASGERPQYQRRASHRHGHHKLATRKAHVNTTSLPSTQSP